MLVCDVSRRVCRPTAVCIGQLAGTHARPASRGTRRATAVKPRPSAWPRVLPRPVGAVRGAGGHPLPRAARPVAKRRPWARKRRKREAFRRAFPARHTYLYAPARLWRAVRGAGALPLLTICCGLFRRSRGDGKGGGAYRRSERRRQSSRRPDAGRFR